MRSISKIISYGILEILALVSLYLAYFFQADGSIAIMADSYFEYADQGSELWFISILFLLSFFSFLIFSWLAIGKNVILLRSYLRDRKSPKHPNQDEDLTIYDLSYLKKQKGI